MLRVYGETTEYFFYKVVPNTSTTSFFFCFTFSVYKKKGRVHNFTLICWCKRMNNTGNAKDPLFLTYSSIYEILSIIYMRTYYPR